MLIHEVIFNSFRRSLCVEQMQSDGFLGKVHLENSITVDWMECRACSMLFLTSPAWMNLMIPIGIARYVVIEWMTVVIITRMVGLW